MKRSFVYLLLVLVIPLFAGSGYLIAGGAGAAGGYILRDKGYEVQSPVEKEDQDNHEE